MNDAAGRLEPVGNYVFCEQDHEAPLIGEFAGGLVAVMTQRSPQKTTPNEDAIALVPLGPAAGVIAVADGCGGMACGEVAAKIAVQAISDSVQQSDPASLRAAILDGFEAATNRVDQLAAGAATTLIVVELNDGVIRTYHVGDSQAIVTGGRGKLKLQTRCHSPVGYAMEAGMLSEQDALSHEDRHLISNVIGDPEAHIDIGLPRSLAPRDTLVVATDGLFDNLGMQEIVELVRKGPLQHSIQATCRHVQQRMAGIQPGAISKPDDWAIVLFRRTRST